MWPVKIVTYLAKRFAIIQRSSAVAAYAPCFLENVDEDQLISDVSRIFALKRADVRAKLCEYRAFHELQGYTERFGERKTLCFEEAFVIYIIIETTRPRTIVEIGTDYGKSMRRIIDMKNLLRLDSQVICFDVVDHVKHFTPDEAQLNIKDVTHSFEQDVLKAYQPGLIFLDARPFYLLKSVISSIVNNQNGWILAIHDCSRGLCNPKMTLNKEDLNITSTTGVWERHVLAELLKIGDPLNYRLDDFKNSTHHVRVFDTPHGLALIMPNRLIQSYGELRCP